MSRTVVLSKTVRDGFLMLLAQGLPKFGQHVIDAKRKAVTDTLETYARTGRSQAF